MMAQVKTQTTEHPGQVNKQVTVERGEVVYVAGNELVVKMENGEIRHFTVPDGAKAMVDGRELTLQELQPGMKLERTITTTSTEKTVRTVKTGTGTVIFVNPPLSVTLQFEDNSVQNFKVPKNTKFTIEGQEKTVFDLRKGMKVTATRIIEVPSVEVASARHVSGSAPPPPPPPPPPEAPPQLGALLIAEATPPTPVAAPTPTTVSEPTPQPAPAAAEPPAKKLPSTGSVVPLIGLLGLLFSGASFGLRLLRRP
jgi:hypothetical protein